MQLKHQNGNIFVDIEGFRPCLSKPSYRAPTWALMVRLMQKERLKSPQKSPIPENQAFLVILGLLAKTSTKTAIILVIPFGQPFPSQGRHAGRKSHLGSGLNRRDRGACGFIRVRSHGKPIKVVSTAFFYGRGFAAMPPFHAITVMKIARPTRKAAPHGIGGEISISPCGTCPQLERHLHSPVTLNGKHQLPRHALMADSQLNKSGAEQRHLLPS